MSTTTDEHGNPPGERDADLSSLIRCTRCKLSYAPAKSTSALKLTYCSFLCELGDLGFSIQGLEHMQLVKKGEEGEAEASDEEPEPQPIGIV
ncbi:MAG: hypothetical protein R3B97_04075 [Dehalococcoidia bacterium]|nr:hypothetical protein [Dehalococcoidia bacterium]MCB9485508.1 hypothetical protein [Thermoflexaceae bacterium]